MIKLKKEKLYIECEENVFMILPFSSWHSVCSSQSPTQEILQYF